MSEMVERVARAMLRGALLQIYPADKIDPKRIDDGWQHYAANARDAIAAMRNPTDQMLADGDCAMPQIAAGQDISTGIDALAEAWPVMIDAALSS